MFLLFFLVSLIQFFIFWIFEPIVTFLEYVLEIRFLPIILLLGFVFTFLLPLPSLTADMGQRPWAQWPMDPMGQCARAH